MYYYIYIERESSHTPASLPLLLSYKQLHILRWAVVRDFQSDHPGLVHLVFVHFRYLILVWWLVIRERFNSEGVVVDKKRTVSISVNLPTLSLSLYIYVYIYIDIDINM